MLFRSIGIFAALACAATSFAAPLSAPSDELAGVAPVEGVALPPVSGLPPTTDINPDDLVAAVENLPEFIAARDTGAHPTIPEIFANATQKLKPINDKIRAELKAGSAAGKADVDAIVGLLVEIIGVLNTVLADLGYVLNNPVGFVLSLQGVNLGIKEVGLLVSTLLHVVVTVLALVLRIVDVALHGKLLPIIAEIGSLLVQIIVLVLRLVPGLLVHIVGVIFPIVKDIKFLHWNDLITKLNLIGVKA
ncbi:hypothetical protein CPC08DRAFT_762985 [Agrocybe pediades]|nr:hypothetical protein CPC08DRAFT_762985 [Agrocybe pediades]